MHIDTFCIVMFAIIINDKLKAKLYSFSYRTHITGTITHGYRGHSFVDLHGWHHDANLVLNILLDVLSQRDFLPDVLYLQLDNTARENKNQFVLAFLPILAIFKEVSASHFLFSFQ